MARSHDVLVLGSGIFGLTAARALNELGLSVLVADRRAPGRGASSGPFGYLAPFSPDRWDEKKAFQLTALSKAQSYWHQVADDAGLDPGYARVGRMVALKSEAERARALERAGHAAKNWGDVWEYVVTEETPHDGTAPHGYACDDLTARIHPQMALSALATALGRTGVDFVENEDIALEDARSRADHVIVAAGYECADILPGLPVTTKGVKGQAALLQSKAFDEVTPIMTVGGVTMVKQSADSVAIGATRERDWDDARGTDSSLDDLISKARIAFPKLERARVLQRWAGVRPRGQTPDPVVGPVPDMDDVWLMTGGYGISFGIAHDVADNLARWITEGVSDLPYRFTVDHHLDRASRPG